MMFITPSPDALQVGTISRSDRWLLYRRLQELKISCWCPADGSLWVEVNHCLDAVLLRSAVQQLVASRPELVNWLERCWETQVPSPSH
ncbi:Asr1405/Asl0597 family protein [Oscillatoria salina]|uniref:Asr1405/Asl0597 family protein n=1 Tax=Oscillatoria salina TaxID=331517 RepID=UPI00296223A7|nr:Asr1405/Asl0597 family protein [Oscillatoria salina]